MNSKIVRRVAIAVAALLLLLAVAAGVLVASFDANRYKGLAIDWMKDKRQRTLAIDGPIELSVFPRLAIKLSKLRLSEPERARGVEFASLDEAALSVQVWPLLKKQLVIDRVSAKGLRVNYSRDTKGVRNIDDLLAAEAGPGGTGSASATASPPLRLDISAVQLDDVQLRIRDDIAKLAGEVTLHSFSSGRLAHQTESPVKLRASITLTQPQAVKLLVDGRTTLKLDLDKNAVGLSDLKFELTGDVAGLKAAALALEARKLSYDPSAQALDLDALKLALTAKQGSGAVELSLDWPQLAVSATQLKGSALGGSFKLSGATSLAGTLRSGPPTGNFESLRLPGVALNVAGNSGGRKIDATLKSDVLLQPGRGAAAFEALNLTATLAEPNAQALQIAAHGTARADAKGAQWAFDGSLNANKFDSSGSAAFGGAVPQLKASARFDSLDFNKVLGPDKPAPAAAAPAESPVDLGGLRAVNGQFAVSANSLAFRQYKLADAKLDATLDNGLLRIGRLAARAWGGSLDASGSADARSQRIAVKMTASNVNVNALLKDVAGKDLLDGTGRVTADVQTHGTSLGALRSNLAGSAALQLRDGAVKGINLARTMRQAKAALSMKQDAVSKARETEKTDFSELSATARIAGGVAQSDDLDVKSPFLRIGGAGRFDIGRGQIDYTARATVIAAPAGQDAGELAALRGVTVPVLLSGPFDAIEWKVQWSGVAAAAVQNTLKEKLNEKLGAKLGLGSAGAAAPAGAASAPAKPQDKLKDKLKGLFK